MLVNLDNVLVELRSDSKQVVSEWRQLFVRQLVAVAPAAGAAIPVSLRLDETRPALPGHPPFFHEQILPGLTLTAHRLENGQILLSLPDGSQIHLTLTGQQAPAASIYTTGSVLEAGRLEDLTTIALAPLLRRRGYYMVHAFGASDERAALLLVGASGRGKTSTGLNLVINGWHYLGNDVVFLQERQGEVYALPSPGGINVSPDSVTLLPALAPLLGRHSPHAADGKYHLPATAVAATVAEPLPVRLICFPEVVDAPASQLLPLSRAEALAYLMIDSVDHWDQEALSAHINLLQRLTKQALCRKLALGSDVAALPALLASALPSAGEGSAG